MSNIIDSIQLSGITYQIQGSGGGGVPESTFTAYTATTDERISQDEEVTAAGLNALNGKITPTVELTQAEYDALTTKDPNTYYIITDAQAGDLTNYYTKSETNTLLGGKADTATTYTKTEVDTALNGKQATLVSGTNIKTINNESILGSGNIDIQGGGKAVSGGTNISITTGETADTINCTLNLENGTNSQSGGLKLKSFVAGNEVSGRDACAFGGGNQANGVNSFVTGFYNTGNTINAFVSGNKNRTTNGNETLFGLWALSNGSRTGDANGYSDATLLAVGNGEWQSQTRHNAFEIRQNGDIYIADTNDTSTTNWYEKPMIKLQDQLGGSSINVVQTTGTSTTDVMSQNAVTTQLSGYVTTDTEQTISGRKIFTYSSSSNKAIEFKQTSDSAKVGFRVINSAATNNEVASFEFRPNTFTIDNVQHPLIYFGHYRTTNTANAGVPQTVIGFRQYDQKNAAAYHYLLPLPEKAKTPFSLTTSFKDYYAPMGFKNGSTMITADNTGVVDLSSELGGLKLVKLTQAEYDALATKDSSTLYIIVN